MVKSNRAALHQPGWPGQVPGAALGGPIVSTPATMSSLSASPSHPCCSLATAAARDASLPITRCVLALVDSESLVPVKCSSQSQLIRVSRKPHPNFTSEPECWNSGSTLDHAAEPTSLSKAWALAYKSRGRLFFHFHNMYAPCPPTRPAPRQTFANLSCYIQENTFRLVPLELRHRKVC